MVWLIDNWESTIDDLLLPLRVQKVQGFHEKITKVLGVSFPAFQGCVFICNEVFDVDTDRVISWHEVAQGIGVVPNLVPSWNGFLRREQETSSAEIPFIQYPPEESVMSEWTLNIVEDIAGHASHAIAIYENHERSSISTGSFVSIPAMQDIPEFLASPYVHTSDSGLELLLLTRGCVRDKSLPVIDYPRANIMWSEENSWVCINSSDGCGTVFFSSNPDVICLILEHPNLEAFLVSPEWHE